MQGEINLLLKDPGKHCLGTQTDFIHVHHQRLSSQRTFMGQLSGTSLSHQFLSRCYFRCTRNPRRCAEGWLGDRARFPYSHVSGTFTKFRLQAVWNVSSAVHYGIFTYVYSRLSCGQGGRLLACRAGPRQTSGSVTLASCFQPRPTLCRSWSSMSHIFMLWFVSLLTPSLVTCETYIVRAFIFRIW